MIASSLTLPPAHYNFAPELTKLLDQLWPGDRLVVRRLDRLGRSRRHLIDRFSQLQDRGIEFRSLQENIDTNAKLAPA